MPLADQRGGGGSAFLMVCKKDFLRLRLPDRMQENEKCLRSEGRMGYDNGE